MSELENLQNNRLKKGLTCKIIVIDNFYENPIEVRTMALKQEFMKHDHHPGTRTISFATLEHKAIFQNILRPFGGNIVDFKLSGDNGSFQSTTSLDSSWIHIDGSISSWAAIVYLTPEAPLSSGTGFFQFNDGAMDDNDQTYLNNSKILKYSNKDLTKWKLVDNVGNIFNRIIFYRSDNFHMSLDYFGNTLHDGRLFQVFFFSTEY